MTQLAEIQLEESVHVTAQGEVPIVHQLLQAREEVRTKEEELRQLREEHEAELSRLAHQSTAKLQETELELKAQIVQANALQHDLQQQLKANDIQINTQINSLEAKIVKLEFLEGISSQEIDQLREELMDKEVEIDYLRKEQAYTTTLSTTATSSPLKLYVTSCFTVVMYLYYTLLH